jgi:DNA processing protein
MKERGLLDLIIARLPGLKPTQRGALCKKLNSEDDIVRLSYKEIIEAAGVSPGYAKQGILDFKDEKNNVPGKFNFNMDDTMREAERDANVMKSRNIQYVSIVSNEYPPLLKEIFDPPAVLFYKGALRGEATKLAVVGTRRPCAAALDWTHRFCSDLGGANISVVSGLALGIDAMAHRGNIDGGGETVAVLGSAVDEVYPQSNRTLARRILEKGGVLVSEYPPGTGPYKWHFPARNRIISGLCEAVLLVEAPVKSGALITANFALDQNRDLFVAAPSAGNVFGEGCGRLTEDGAKRINNIRDLPGEWNIEWNGADRNKESKHEENKNAASELAEMTIKELGGL